MTDMITTDNDGFNAFGKPVPWARKAAALKHVRQMVPGCTTEAAVQLIDRVANHVERDDPYAALAHASHAAWTVHESNVEEAVAVARSLDPDQMIVLDPIGAYRLLAVLCTDAVAAAPAPATKAAPAKKAAKTATAKRATS
jgi:hypothetical protein